MAAKRNETRELVPAAQVEVDYPLLAGGGATASGAILANTGGDGFGEFDLDKIKVPAGGTTKWVVPSLEGEREESILEGVLIHWKDARAYWAAGLEESGGGSPPDCSSIDGKHGRGNPALGIQQGQDCASCQFSQFGTAKKGRGQACKQMKVLFLLMQGQMLPHAVFVPPTSIQPVKKYLLRLASMGLMFCDVVTRLALEKTKNTGGITFSRIVPSMARRLEEVEKTGARMLAKQLKPQLDRVIIDAEVASEQPA